MTTIKNYPTTSEVSSVKTNTLDKDLSEKKEVQLLKFGNNNLNVLNNTIQIKSAEDAVDFACNLLGINQETPEYELLQKDVTLKYNTMIRVASAKGEILDPAIIQARIQNYVKGWSFNQFEQQAILSNNPQTWEYSVPEEISDEEALKLLKEHYKNLTDGYIEFYNKDGNDSIDIIEMYVQELAEHYLSKGLSYNQAHLKATEVALKFDKMSFAEIDQSNDTSDEMQLYKLLQVKFGTLEDAPKKHMTIEDIRTLDAKEIQAYLFTKAQFDGNGSNTITPTESGAIEYDIMTGGSKTPNWLKAAREFLGL